MNKKITFMLLAVLLVISACSTSSKSVTVSPKQVLVFIPSENVADSELNDVTSELDKAGVTYAVASIEGTTVSGMNGGSFEPDLQLTDIKADNYEMVVFIGGTGSYNLFSNAAIHALAKVFSYKGKYVTAICAAPGILANAGLLDSKEATCYPDPNVVNLLKENGADYQKKAVVISGKIVTSNGPQSAKAFGKALAELLS